MTDKFDAVNAIEAALEDHPHERELFDWLRKYLANYCWPVDL